MSKGAIRRKPTPESDELRASVLKFMEVRNIKPTPWAVAAGVPESTLRSFLDGTASAPRYDTLKKLAKAQKTIVAELAGERIQVPRAVRDSVPVKSLEVTAAMGGGREGARYEIVDEPEGPPFFFRRDWLETILAQHPGRLRVHWFGGRSMEPTINDGDVGLIHLDWGGADPGIYTLWDGSGIVTKRLEAISSHRLRLISDNPQWPPYEAAVDEVMVIGRVIWRGGTLL